MSRNEDPWYMYEDVKVKYTSVKELLIIIKDKCLNCTNRQILKVMECKKEICPLWKVRKYTISNGDGRKWDQTQVKLEESKTE